MYCMKQLLTVINFLATIYKKNKGIFPDLCHTDYGRLVTDYYYYYYY